MPAPTTLESQSVEFLDRPVATGAGPAPDGHGDRFRPAIPRLIRAPTRH
jgi:hypothetical protein